MRSSELSPQNLDNDHLVWDAERSCVLVQYTSSGSRAGCASLDCQVNANIHDFKRSASQAATPSLLIYFSVLCESSWRVSSSRLATVTWETLGCWSLRTF